jgi:FkbM family methyltransferase
LSRYAIKNRLLSPRSAYRRRRLAADLDPYGRAMFELHHYDPAIFSFARATAANPDILTDGDLDRDSVVVDAGAFVGEWCGRVSDRYGSTIYAFEPNPQAFTTLEATLGDRPSIRTFACGLGGADVTAQLTLDGPGASIYPGDTDQPTVAIEIRDASTLFDELGLERIDLLKVNIEGGEYDLLDRLIASGWIERVGGVSVQFHEWHPHAYRRRRAIRRALRATHDEVWCYPWVWELWSSRSSAG